MKVGFRPGRNGVAGTNPVVLIAIMAPHQRTCGADAERNDTTVVAAKQFLFEILPQKRLQGIVDLVAGICGVVADFFKQPSGIHLAVPRYVIDGFGATIFEGLCRRLHFCKDTLLAETAKNLLKLIIVGVVGFSLLYRFAPGLVTAQAMLPEAAVAYAKMAGLRIALTCTALLLVLAILDYIYQRFEFEIFPEWRARYAPGVTRNTEHVFGLVVPAAAAVVLSPHEHLAWRWLPWRQAAEAVFSWSNAAAIRQLPERLAF